MARTKYDTDEGENDKLTDDQEEEVASNNRAI